MHLHRTDPALLVGLLSLDDADQLLTSTAIRTPSIRLARDGSVLAESTYTRGATLAGKQLTGLVDPRKALAEFGQGATVVFQGLHRYWPPLTRLVAELELELGHPCQANAYLTPPGSQGFAVHSDSHDVFVFQTEGSKRWEVHTPDGVEDILLEPGLAMYLPTGTPHAARAQDTVSLHVTLGITQLTWRGLVERSVRAVLADVPNEHLPAGYLDSPEDLADELGERLEALAARGTPRRRHRRGPGRGPPLPDHAQPPAAGWPPGRPCRRRPRRHDVAAPPAGPPVRHPRPGRAARRTPRRPLDRRTRLAPAGAGRDPRAAGAAAGRPGRRAGPAEPRGALPPPDAGRPARGRRMILPDPGFRCAGASALRDEPVAGTASTVRAFLLVEHAGSWGTNALRDARLPGDLGPKLRRASAETGVRILLVRRAGRRPRKGHITVFAAYAHPHRPWLERGDLTDPHDILDLDLAGLA